MFTLSLTGCGRPRHTVVPGHRKRPAREASVSEIPLPFVDVFLHDLKTSGISQVQLRVQLVVQAEYHHVQAVLGCLHLDSLSKRIVGARVHVQELERPLLSVVLEGL